MSETPALSVIIFAWNEAENIAPVLDELVGWLREHEPSHEVVFVDDGSRDGTAARAEAALADTPHRVLRHPVNRGIGAALKTGVDGARGDWVTFLPADGQIAPDAIGVLRAEAARAEADVVFSVYDNRDDGLRRKVLSAGVRGLITLVHGVRMRSDGPYLFRRALFVPEQLRSDTFFLNFEFPIRVLSAGLPVSEVTIACRPRRAGVSKTANWRRALWVARELVSLRRERVREMVRVVRGG